MPVKETVLCDGIKWIDLTNPTREEVEHVNHDYGFNQHLLHDCLDPDHLLPKYEVLKKMHFLLVRYYNHSIDKRIATIQELTSKIALFYTDTIVVSIHREELHFLHDVKLKCVDEGTVTTIPALIAKILWYAI